MNPPTRISKHALQGGLDAGKATSEEIVDRLSSPDSWYLREYEIIVGVQLQGMCYHLNTSPVGHINVPGASLGQERARISSGTPRANNQDVFSLKLSTPEEGERPSKRQAEIKAVSLTF